MKAKNKILWKFVNNTGWILFKEIYAMLVSLIVGSLSARYLGPSNYGLINYGSSFISFFWIVSQLGLSNFVVPELVRRPEKEAIYLGTSLMMRLTASFLSIFIIQGIVVFLEPAKPLLYFITFLQSISIIFRSIDTVLCFWFQAKMEMKYVTLTGMIALTLTSVWRITILAQEASVEWFAASSSISAGISAFVIGLFFYKKARLKLKFCMKEAVYILKNSYHFIINSVTMTFYTQLDKIMIGKMLDETYLGYYTAASSISVMWEIVPNAIMNSAKPLLVQKYDSDKKEFVKRYQMLLLGITILGIFVGFCFSAFAKLAVWILYGKDYYASIPALRILIWSTVCSMIASGKTVWMVLEKQSKYIERFTLIGAVINIGLNVIFIYTGGYIGAAWATLAASFLGMLMPLFFKETKEYAFIYFGSFKQIPQLLKYVKNRISIIK